MCISTIAVGAVWMILSSKPVIEQKVEAPGKRTLAYQEAIAQREESKTKPAPEAAVVPPSEPAPKDTGAGGTAASQDMAALPEEGTSSEAPAAEPLPWAADHPQQWGDGQGQQDDMAYGTPPGNPYTPPTAGPYGQQPGNLDDRRNGYGPPPEESYGRQQDPYGRQQDPYGRQQQDPYAQQQQDPNAQQQDPYAQQQQDPYAQQRDPNAQQQDPYAQPQQQDPYAQPQQQDPYAQQQDPYAQQQDPYGRQPAPYGQPQQGQWSGQPGEEWVQVIGSGTGMRATASIDAPILFAFPYGRQLKVVSRNEDWVEVADPNTSTKGWMPAYALAPSAGPNAYNNYGQQAYEEQPEERRGLFRRGGFADMINRAFGGN